MSVGNKELYGIRVWNVAIDYNLTQVAVKSTLDTFVDVCTELLKDGTIVRLSNLATIKPNNVRSNFIPTLGYICELVSKKCSVSYYTVYAVISAHLSSIEDELLDGRSADIRKLILFHSIGNGNGSSKVNCFLSSTLRNNLRCSGRQTGARVYMSKLLRFKIKEGVV